ncbi:MAG: hypothetical protein HYU77_02280 [Betaproteobacteria bacterium]|nr:hypothetical protein [Betaproteobacteria bacterium]
MHLKTVYKEKPVPMQDFDGQHHIKLLNEVLGTLTDPRRRQIMQNTIEHLTTLGSGHYAELMAACSRERQSYYSWGRGDPLPGTNPQSYEELEAYYKYVVDSRAWMVHAELDKIIVGDDEIVLDGVLHQLCPTELIEPMFGIQVDTAYRAYQMTKRMCMIFMFDEDGIGCGAHAYYNGPTSAKDLTPVADQYLPDIFRPVA